MERKLITDLDNTVFDFSPHYERWAIENGYSIKKNLLSKTYCFQSIHDEEIDVDKHVSEFFLDEAFVSSFPFLNGTIEPMQRLHEKGWGFVAVSACNHPEIAHLRKKNLESILGFEFEEIHITGYHDSKMPVLKKYEPSTSIWVEDSTKHAAEGAAEGFRTFLIDHPYNRHTNDELYTRVIDWTDIERIV